MWHRARRDSSDPVETDVIHPRSYCPWHHTPADRRRGNGVHVASAILPEGHAISGACASRPRAMSRWPSRARGADPAGLPRNRDDARVDVDLVPRTCQRSRLSEATSPSSIPGSLASGCGSCAPGGLGRVSLTCYRRRNMVVHAQVLPV